MTKQSNSPKHIVIDARIRLSSTGKPVDRLLEYLPNYDPLNNYTILVRPEDNWKTQARNIAVLKTRFPIFSFNPLNQFLFSIELYKLKPDLVFFTLTGQQPLFYFGKQITLTHDLTMYEYVRAGKLPAWLHQIRMIGYKLIMWVAHRKSRQIIVPSNYVKRCLSQFHSFTTSKITRIYESSEPPIKSKPTKPANISGKFLLHVGSPFPHKNINRLIESFRTINQSQPKLQLVLAGKKEYFMDSLIAKYKLDEDPNIIVTGFVSDPELKWLYQNAACYVLPSLSEGFGLPGLEAMAHNCPLVSSSATCLPEIYGEAAVYFDPRDIDNMTNKINTVILDKQLQQNLVAQGQKQLAKYSWKKMTRQMIDVINQQV